MTLRAAFDFTAPAHGSPISCLRLRLRPIGLGHARGAAERQAAGAQDAGATPGGFAPLHFCCAVQSSAAAPYSLAPPYPTASPVTFRAQRLGVGPGV